MYSFIYLLALWLIHIWELPLQTDYYQNVEYEFWETLSQSPLISSCPWDIELVFEGGAWVEKWPADF